MSNYILLYLVFVNALYHRAVLSTDYLGNLSFTLQPELCPDGRLCAFVKVLKWWELRINNDQLIVLTIKFLAIMEKVMYVAPELEVLEVMVEQGFAASPDEDPGFSNPGAGGIF